MTTLQFYVENRSKHNNGRFEYVIFTLDKSDFKTYLEHLFFKKLKDYHANGCGNGCDHDTFIKCRLCTNIPDTIEKITEKCSYNNI